ncbi:MAG: sulfatase [Verrucomicrobia bacterium]|nr:sulfatase [Verrucomicrobiota bacterium]
MNSLLTSLFHTGAFLLAAATLTAATPQKPNVLFIAIDDLRDWVGYYGRNLQTKTPNFDRLAKLSTAFSRAYCASPVCNPSRTALMSGMRPSTTGVYENNIDFRPIIAPDKMLTTAFRQAGYRVTGAGKIYHEAYRRDSEWDDYLQREGGGRDRLRAGQNDGVGGIKFAPLDCQDEDLPDWNIADYGIAELAKKHDKPFFLAVGFHKPHMPWNVPKKWFDLFPLSSIQLPPYQENDLDDVPPAGVRMAHPETDHVPMQKSGRWKEAIQAYLATIAYCDMNLGRVLDAYEKSPDRANTILCLWSDHGWHLGEKHHWRKFALWEESTRSPFMWIVPGLTKPGTICERTIDYMGIYPTLAELCGVPVPAHVEGRSFRALLADPNAPWDQPAITTYKYKNHTVRSAGWRYIRYANGDEELYDETKDPNEWTNLAAKPEFAARKAEFARFLPKSDIADPSANAKDDETRAAKKAKRQAKKN